MTIDIIDLNVIDYEQAWKLQDQYAAEIATGERPPTLLLLEHPHVYTFGRRGNAANLLWDEAQRKEKGIATHWVDRGGDVTYHGPGQLVGYPLLPLGALTHNNRLPEVDYVGYVRKLETLLINVLMQFGIASGQRAGKTGVWIQADVHSRCIHCPPAERKKPAKIAAIGIKVDSKGITRHGFALNVNPDMEYFNGIIACGLNEPVASLADLLEPPPTMQTVKQRVADTFRTVFEKDQSATAHASRP